MIDGYQFSLQNVQVASLLNSPISASSSQGNSVNIRKPEHCIFLSNRFREKIMRNNWLSNSMKAKRVKQTESRSNTTSACLTLSTAVQPLSRKDNASCYWQHRALPARKGLSIKSNSTVAFQLHRDMKPFTIRLALLRIRIEKLGLVCLKNWLTAINAS